MMGQPQVQNLGEHRYLVRAQQDDDIVEILVQTTPAVIAQLGLDETDEPRVIEATAAYLLARQRADDLPGQLDLEEVVAAYDGFEDELRRRMDGPDLSNQA